MLEIKLACFSMSPFWSTLAIINVLDDDVHKNVCLGGWSAGCCAASYSCQLMCSVMELLLAHGVFLCIWKGILLVITLRNKEESVSNEHPITLWRERNTVIHIRI